MARGNSRPWFIGPLFAEVVLLVIAVFAFGPSEKVNVLVSLLGLKGHVVLDRGNFPAEYHAYFYVTLASFMVLSIAYVAAATFIRNR